MLVDDFLHLAVEQFDVAVDRRSGVEVVQRRPLNVAVERRQVDATYVTVAVARDDRQVTWHVQTTGDEMMVAEACWIARPPQTCIRLGIVTYLFRLHVLCYRPISKVATGPAFG